MAAVRIVSPSSGVSLAVGVTLTLSAVVVGPAGLPVANSSVTWASSDSTVCVVSSTGPLTGRVTAVGAGSASVIASVSGKRAELSLSVSVEQAFISTDGVLSLIPLPAVATRSWGTGINDAGEVVGYYLIGSSYLRHAFVWSARKGFRELFPTAVGASSPYGAMATAINSNGQVAGWAGAGKDEVHATLWSGAGVPVDLGLVPGSLHSFGAGISDSGWVVGESWTTTGVRPFLWTPDRGIRQLGSARDEPGRAIAVNNDGLIVGALIETGDNYGMTNVGAVVWSASGKQSQLFDCYGGGECAAAAVNRDGVVAGSSLGAAFRWTARGGLETLDSPLITAVGINDAGLIVGQVMGGAAVLWPDGTLRTVGTLPRTRSIGPAAINNRGQVVGTIQ